MQRVRSARLLPTLFGTAALLGMPLEAAATSVVGRYVFYNGSAYDGFDPAIGASDDAAIATDKVALLPGETATSANFTSYLSGLNGIMIDVQGLADAGALSLSDFVFRVGDGSDLSLWSPAPTPADLGVRAGAGVGGSDRVTLVWSNDAIEDEWLEITLGATAATGLASADVFYFGSLAGDASLDANVDPFDSLVITNLLNAGGGGPTDITDPLDLDRDGLVSAADSLAVSAILNAQGPHGLELISVVPEPARLLQLALALCALAAFRPPSRERPRDRGLR